MISLAQISWYVCFEEEEETKTAATTRLFFFFFQMTMMKTETIIHSDQIVCVRECEREKKDEIITSITQQVESALLMQITQTNIFFFYLTPIGFYCIAQTKNKRYHDSLMNKNDEIRNVVDIKCIQIGNYWLQHCIRMIIKSSDYLLFLCLIPSKNTKLTQTHADY